MVKIAFVPFMFGMLWAQEADQTIFRTQTRLVVLHATAEDKEGHLMMELPKSAFQIYENGVRQEIKEFPPGGRAGLTGTHHRQQRQHDRQA